MLLNSVSTLGLARRMQSSITGLQIDQARVTEEVASGKRADVAGYLGARTGQAISLRHLHERTTEYLNTVTFLGSQMGLMDEALTGMHQAGADLLALANTGLGDDSQILQGVQIKARGALQEMVGHLNSASGNGHLFAGTDSQRAPMRQLDGDDSGLRSPLRIVQDAIAAAVGGPPAPATAAETAATVAALDALFSVRDPATPAPAPLTDTFEGGMYLGTTSLAPGGAANPRIAGRPEDGVQLDFGIQANDPMIRDMLQGMYMLAAVDVNAMPREAQEPYIQAAVAKLAGGLQGLRDAQANLGVQHAQVEAMELRHTARLTVLNLRINQLEDVDPFETQTRLTQVQAQLEAAMSATARVSRLRLTNFL